MRTTIIAAVDLRFMPQEIGLTCVVFRVRFGRLDSKSVSQ